jgi:hypothetical protein
MYSKHVLRLGSITTDESDGQIVSIERDRHWANTDTKMVSTDEGMQIDESMKV